MTNKLYDEASVQAIAEAIRFKNGSTDTYNIAEMGSTVLSVPLPNIPKYHYEEAIRVGDNILSRKNDNCLVFGVITDNHINIGETYEALSKTSVKNGSFALELVGNFAECDFIANLGDNQWANNIDTDNAFACGDYTRKLTQSAFNQHIGFRLVGNHDQTANNIARQWELIGQYNSFDSTGLTKERCYGYKDFTDKKVRVICLNTSDYLNGTGGYGVSYEQKDFLISALDLSEKSDCAEWKILILSHIPLDFYSADYNVTADIMNILKAYADGTSVTITVNDSWASIHDDTTTGTLSYDYSGKNSARLIGNIHGHLHNDCYGKLGYTDGDGNIVTTDITRVSSPNTCFYLGKDTAYSSNGDYSSELIERTENTVTDTSVTFYVIDTEKETIYSYAYGAGKDRVIIYGELPYTNLFDETAVTAPMRFNSSGEIVEGNFWCMSTYLECKEDDIVRVYCPNGIWAEHTHRVIATYDSTKTHVDSDLYSEKNETADIDHLFTGTIASGVSYIRVSGLPYNNLDGVVITINEEII